jgi:hypothetical protein
MLNRSPKCVFESLRQIETAAAVHAAHFKAHFAIRFDEHIDFLEFHKIKLAPRGFLLRSGHAPQHQVDLPVFGRFF